MMWFLLAGFFCLLIVIGAFISDRPVGFAVGSIIVLMAVSFVFIVGYVIYMISTSGRQQSVQTTPQPLVNNYSDNQSASDSEVSQIEDDSGDLEPRILYPNYAKIAGPSSITLQLSAYGSSTDIIGLKGWTGDDYVGADGTEVTNIFPIGGSKKSGQRIIYYRIPACAGCMFSEAAPYFSDAMKSWNRSYNQDNSNPVAIPEGLEVTTLSPTLAKYKLPDENGLLVRGVMYYGPDSMGDQHLEEATFYLLRDKADVADFLIKEFISRNGLK